MRPWLHECINFFFPAYCPVCGKVLHMPGEVICLTCEQKMPLTSYLEDPDNPVSQLFWGRVRIEGAFSLLRFEKGSKYQPLLHFLKYKGHKQIGNFLGRKLGAAIRNSPFAYTDLIVPVPLHQKKERARGYNQSTIIANGISEITNVPVNEEILLRGINTHSQTRRNRYERWENMDGVFELHNGAEKFCGYCLLLVDDVITTGSTIEACANTLLQIPYVQIFVVTVACA